MKNKLIIIIKIILMIIVYGIVNIILRIGPQVIWTAGNSRIVRDLL